MVDEYAFIQGLFAAQPGPVRRSMEEQGRALAKALVQGAAHLAFLLPEQVLDQDPGSGSGKLLVIPKRYRWQKLGGFLGLQARSHLNDALNRRLLELENDPDRAVALSALLLRHAMAFHIVHRLLPSGQPVKYIAAGGENIPSIPVADGTSKGTTSSSKEQGNSPLPCPPSARLFYLPEWVAFDDQGRLLVDSAQEAETRVKSMQGCLKALHTAAALEPCILADEEYQLKHYGMLGQLVNQGRALARFYTKQIILGIRRRAAENSLNRGFSLSLPYFDDQALELRSYDFEVIPFGRVQFVPAFVVCAVRDQEERVAQDESLSASTRRHLLAELREIEHSFESSGGSPHSGTKARIKKTAFAAGKTALAPAPAQAGGAVSIQKIIWVHFKGLHHNKG